MSAPVHPLQRAAFFFATYGLLAGLSLWCAYQLRFVGSDEPTNAGYAAFESYLTGQRPYALLWVIPLKVLLLGLAGQFRGVFYYFRLPDALRMGLALLGATVLMLGAPLLTAGSDAARYFAIPRGVTLVDFNLSLILFLGFRVSVRTLRERSSSDSRAAKGAVERIAIVGAGQTGAQLASELLSRRGHGLEPVCFLDDNPAKHGLQIHGIPVIGAPERMPELAGKFGVTQIILALPADRVRRIREVSELASAARLRVLVVPSMAELAIGRVRATDIRPISVEDILGRPAANLDDAAIDGLIRGRTVLVTGAGGSIGLELCRQIAARAPARLILLDQCEVLLYQAEQELIACGAGAVIAPVVADVADRASLRAIFARHRPSLVLHAAAHKHVPMMESQPAEALQNNVLGTHVVADLAAEHGVETFVLISSDKAVNPTNVMGASKRLAEQVVHAHQARSAGRTRFLAVRFGNVLGSSGSVIPIFRRQIAAGGPVTVTHPDVKRYFMTIPEAVGLVLQSATLGAGGDILVLEMGEPMKIIDVARQLIELSGLRPDVDIEIRLIGLRPGEKLVEELKYAAEEYLPTAHARIRRCATGPGQAADVDALVGAVTALRELPTAECKQGIRRLVPEYAPFAE